MISAFVPRRFLTVTRIAAVVEGEFGALFAFGLGLVVVIVVDNNDDVVVVRVCLVLLDDEEEGGCLFWQR